MDNVRPGQGRAPDAALVTSAGFRDESGGQPLVYGYLRSAQRSDRLTAYRRALERYCRRERLRLCAVFTDHGVGGDMLVRPGLVGLCDVLRLPDSFGAVLVSVSNLSRDNSLAAQLMQQIRGTGARLLIVRQPTRDAGGKSPPCAQPPEWWE